MNAETTATPSLVVIDPACPKCKYNLRGLQGEFVSCPECGSQWSHRDLLWVTWQRNCDSSPLVRQLDGIAAMGMFGLTGSVIMVGVLAAGGTKLAIQHPIFLVSIAGFTVLLLTAFAIGTTAKCRRLFGWRLGLRLMAVAVAELCALPISLLSGPVGVVTVLIVTLSQEMSAILLVVCAALLALCPISYWGGRCLHAKKVRLLFTWIEASADRLRVTQDAQAS